MADFEGDQWSIVVDTAGLRQWEEDLDVVVGALEGGVVPGEDVFEGTALFVGAFDGRVVEADEHVLRAGTHVDDLLFGSGEWW